MFLLLVISTLIPIINCGDMSLLCAEEEPIDAAFKYRDVVFIIKKSNVWRFERQYTNPGMVDGPIPISKMFTGLPELDSIDAIFHINTDLSVSADPNWRTMSDLAIVFSKSKYHIFRVQPDGEYFSYIYYNYSIGVPFGLPVGSGPLKHFKAGDNQRVDAALFDRFKSEAMIISGTNIFTLSGFTKDEAFKKSSKSPSKKRLLNVFKLSDNITAAMDINNVGSVVLFFSKQYCQVNMSNPICYKKSIFNDMFRCDDITNDSTDDDDQEQEGTASTLKAEAAGEQNKNSVQNISTKVTTHKTKRPTIAENPSGKDNKKMIVIASVVGIVIVLIIIIAMFAFCVMRRKSSGSEGKGGSASARGGRSRASQKTTFSNTFRP